MAAAAVVATAVGLMAYLTLTAVDVHQSGQRPATPSPPAEIQLLGRPGGAPDLGDLRHEVGQTPPTTADPTPRGDQPSTEGRIRPTAAPSGAGSATSSPGPSRTSAPSSIGSPISSSRPSSTAEAKARTVARAMLAEFGWGQSEFGCLSAMWNRLGLWGSAAQVRPGLGYIAGRYGSPCAARAHVRETGQY